MHATYITFVGLGVRMLLHMFVEITLNVEDLVADITDVRLFLGVFPHMSEKLVE